VVTQGMYSTINKHNIAIARLPVDCATTGTPLVVSSGGKDIAATTHPMPFYDPEKKRRTVKG